MIHQYYPETEWERARLGKITASEIFRLFVLPKSAKDRKAGELSKTAKEYVEECAAELITGQVRGLSTFATEWGKKTEPLAIEFLQQFYPGLTYYGVENQVFMPYDNHSGGSPDAEQSPTLVFEGKCPEDPTVHVRYCLMKDQSDLKKEHYFQLQFNMVCVAIKNKVDFASMEGVFFSFYPDIVDPYPKMKTIRVTPDMDFYKKLPDVIVKAELHLLDVLETLKGVEQKMIAA